MPEERSWRVLNVNDTESARYLVSRILTSRGFEVTEARNGSEALALARKVQPDIVVLDIKLPDVSGYEVCRQLKSSPETSGIKVVMLTARGADVDRARAREAGADDYFIKPFSPIQLLNKVYALLE